MFGLDFLMVYIVVCIIGFGVCFCCWICFVFPFWVSGLVSHSETFLFFGF